MMHRTKRNSPSHTVSRSSISQKVFGVLAVFAVAFAIVSMHSSSDNQNTNSMPAVLGRSYPLPQADIPAGAGGTIEDSGISVIVREGTFNKDVYLRVDRTARGNPVSVNGLWQVSDMWNVRLRNHENDDEMSSIETLKDINIAFPYTLEYLKTDQGVRFDENQLKLIRGETASGPWNVLEGSVIDLSNKKISILTTQGGYYFVGGGFYKTTDKFHNEITPAKTILKDNEIIVTMTPTPTITPVVSLQQDNTSNSRKNPAKTEENIGGFSQRDDSIWSSLIGLIKTIFN